MLLPKLPLFLSQQVSTLPCHQPPRRVRLPAVRTTAQPYTAGMATLLVAAVRKSASEVPLCACNSKRNFKDAQPPFHSGWRLRWFDCSAISLTLRCCASVPFASLRTSSAHSRRRLASSAEIPYCVLSSDQAGRLAAAGFCVSKILRRAGARRALRGAPRSACPAPEQQHKSASTCKSVLCVPQWPFPVPD